MICSKCGSELEDGALFCASCGAKVETEEAAEEPTTDKQAFGDGQTEQGGTESGADEWSSYSAPQSPPTSAGNATYGGTGASEGRSVSLGNWICRYIINFVPCVGNFIFFIMLFVWAFDKKYDETSRNWAKANIVFMAVCYALVIIAMIVAAVISAGSVSTMMHYRRMY